MKQKFFVMAMVCMLFLTFGQVNAMTMRAEAAPLWGLDTLAMSVPFTVGIYMNNDDSVSANPQTGYRMAYSTPFAFYSPDASIANVTHVNVGGSGPTANIEFLNGFDAFWGMFFMTVPWSYEGSLPDSINFTGIANQATGFPFGLGEQVYIRFNFQSDEAGTFCIDSIGGQTTTYDWLLDPPSPPFNGPYCWIVYDTSYIPPIALTIPDTEGPNCSAACVPITVGNFSGVAGVELHISYGDTCMTYDSVSLGYLSGATVNEADGVIHIIWEDYMNPLTLTDGDTLTQLCFSDLCPCVCPIGFQATCELVNTDGDSIPLETTDGSLYCTACDPPMITCPETAIDTTVCAGQEVCIDLPISGADSVWTDADSWTNDQLCFTPYSSDAYPFAVYAYNVCGADTCYLTINVTVVDSVVITCPGAMFYDTLCGSDSICVSVPITGADDVIVTGPAVWSAGMLCFLADTTGTYAFGIEASNPCDLQLCDVDVNVVINDVPAVPSGPYAADSVDADADYPVCWNAVGDADYYVITQYDSTGILSIDTLADTCLTYNNTAGEYSYAVTACNDCGCSEPSQLVYVIVVEPVVVCATLDLPEYLYDHCDSIFLPVLVGDFCEVAGVELHIPYDTMCLSFKYVAEGYLTGATTNESDGVIHIVWEDFMNPLCLTDGESLASLCFDGSSETPCPVGFAESCEVVDTNGDPICLYTYDGSLACTETCVPPEITCPEMPIDTFLCIAAEVCIDLPITGADTVWTSGGTWDNDMFCFTADSTETYYFTIVAFAEGCDSVLCELAVNVEIGAQVAIDCPDFPFYIDLCEPDTVSVPLVIHNADNVMVDGAIWMNDELIFYADRDTVYTFAVFADNLCSDDSCLVTVNVNIADAPTACFQPSVGVGTAPLEVTFSNCSICDDSCTYFWDFGDSTYSTDFEPTHTYTDLGCYTVILIVTNECGVDDMAVMDSAVCVTEIFPTEWISVYCAAPTLNGTPLTPGDVISAYDPDEVMCGSGEVQPDGSYGFMPIYRDDVTTPEDEGADPGDEISFRINDVPVTTNPIIYWTANGDYFELCEFTSERCLTFDLAVGWNWISWNVQYTDDIRQFVLDFQSCIDVVLSFDQGGLTYVPGLFEFSTLTDVDYYHGYLLKMSCPAQFVLCGPDIDEAESIQVFNGWNLISYWPTDVLLVEDALASIINTTLVVLGYESGGLTWAPDFVDFNTLTHMKPKFGYWLKSSADAILSYPGFILPPVAAKTGYRTYDVLPSRSWMSIYGAGITLDGHPIPADAEIDIRTEEGILCGSSALRGGVLKFTPVYGYDDADEITLSYPVQGTMLEVYVDGIRAYPDLNWDGGECVRLEALTSTKDGTDYIRPDIYILYQNYPNPFNPQTTIKFNLPTAGNVELAIYNMLGQKIRTLAHESYASGEHEVVWDGCTDDGQLMASGVYFYRLKAGEFVETKKMNLMK